MELLKRWSLAAAAAALLALCAAPLQAQTELEEGVHRVCDLQADITEDNAGNGFADDDPDDGGWDWYLAPTLTGHTSSPSPTNLYGLAALGVFRVLQSNAGLTPLSQPAGFAGIDCFGQFPSTGSTVLKLNRLIVACLDVYTGALANPDIDSAPDFLFLTDFELTCPYPVTGFADLARTRYDAKITIHGSAQLLGESIRDFRGNINQDGFIPYDLYWYVEGALALDRAFPGQGYDLDAAAFAQVIADDINNPTGFFDINDPLETGYTIGLACGAASLYLTGLEPLLMDDMFTLLLPLQLADGSFPYNGNSTEGTVQTTAYVVMSLGLDVSPGHLTAAQDASNWIASKQQDNGGWRSGGWEYPVIDSEALIALCLVPPETRRIESDGPPRAEAAPQRVPIALPLD
jgi:hypothetical protein